RGRPRRTRGGGIAKRHRSGHLQRGPHQVSMADTCVAARTGSMAEPRPPRAGSNVRPVRSARTSGAARPGLPPSLKSDPHLGGHLDQVLCVFRQLAHWRYLKSPEKRVLRMHEDPAVAPTQNALQYGSVDVAVT